MATPLLAMSRPGFSAETAQPHQLIWSSQYASFKIANQGTAAVTMGSGQTTGTTTIPHSLGYAPAFTVFAESQNTGFSAYRQLVNAFSLEPGTDFTGVSAWATAGSLVIRAERDELLASHYPNAKTIQLYYYIFVDPAG